MPKVKQDDEKESKVESIVESKVESIEESKVESKVESIEEYKKGVKIINLTVHRYDIVGLQLAPKKEISIDAQSWENYKSLKGFEEKIKHAEKLGIIKIS